MATLRCALAKIRPPRLLECRALHVNTKFNLVGRINASSSSAAVRSATTTTRRSFNTARLRQCYWRDPGRGQSSGPAAAASAAAAVAAAAASILIADGSVAKAEGGEDLDGGSVEEMQRKEWDAFMFKSIAPGEDDDDDDDDEEEEDEEDDEEEEEEEDSEVIDQDESPVDDFVGDADAISKTDLQAWLTDQMVSAEAYDANDLLEHFLVEMEKGLAAGPSSLAMIPAYVNAQSTVPPNTPVAVIDAGGTNLRICIAHFDEQGNIQLERLCAQTMPGRDKEISAHDFYQVLVDALQTRSGDFDRIGFCFSYPADITPNYDGKLLHWTKEIKIPDLIGTHVGKGLADALERNGVHGKHVVVLNDTVACLLAGLAKGQTFDASSYVGFILGTGTNTAYVEDNVNLTKLPNLTEGSQVINVESGGFAALDRGPVDVQVDAKSENPGAHVFEKCISGEYIGTITLGLLQALASEGDRPTLSDSGAVALQNIKNLSTVHVSNFASQKGGDVGRLGSDAFTDADKDIIQTVFNSVVDRAALLTAVNILAAVVKSGAGHDPERPVCINIDGSTYYKTYRLAEKVQEKLNKMLEERNLHVMCIHVDNAPGVGAAIAGLTTAFN